MIELISGFQDHEHLANRTLLPDSRPLLVEITPPHALAARYLRPETPITETSLFTGAPGDPQKGARVVRSAPAHPGLRGVG